MPKTNYTDPTIATDPPGGKHHRTSSEGQKLPIDRPVDKKADLKPKKTVGRKTASKSTH